MLNSNDSRKKILERVKALLAMGSDASSPNEAAIALKRARVLMDKYQIELTDIENTHEDDLTTGAYYSGNSQRKRWFEYIAAKIAVLNDCKITVMVVYKDGKKCVTYDFSGFKEDVELSKFMMSYIYDTALRLYKRDKGELGIKGKSGKNSYLLGISAGIRNRMNDAIEERKQDGEVVGGRQLMIVKSQVVEARFGKNKFKQTSGTSNINGDARAAGLRASNEINLGNFVGNSQQQEALN